MLKVPADPPAEHLVAALLKSPPRDVISAQRCFEVGPSVSISTSPCKLTSLLHPHTQYLGAKVSNLPGAAVDSLYHSAIVPVLEAKSKMLALKAPKDVYLAEAGRDGAPSKGYKSLCVILLP